MFVVVIKGEPNTPIAHTVTESVTFGIVVISFMVDYLAMLIWHNLLSRLSLRALHLCLKGSLLHLLNMKSIFTSLKRPHPPPLLLMLPRPVMSLLISHTPSLLVHGSLIPVHPIIFLVIRTSSLPFLSLLPYP